MDCSRRRVLTCVACASDHCNACAILWRNHMHNMLIEGPDLAHSLETNVAHSTQNRSDLLYIALYVSSEHIPHLERASLGFDFIRKCWRHNHNYHPFCGLVKAWCATANKHIMAMANIFLNYRCLKRSCPKNTVVPIGIEQRTNEHHW